MTPETLLDAGDHIVALGVFTGTYKSTRKQVRAQFAHIWTLARGKVRELLELALQAHGGLDRWREVQSLDIHVSLTGALRLELERQNARLRLLLDLTNRITSNLDLRELPRAISARPKVVLAAPLSTICECAMENANPCFVLTPSPTVTRNRSSSNHSPPPLPLNTAKNSTFQQIAARRRLLTICNLTLMDLVDVWARWQRGMVATSSHDTLNVIFLRRKGDAHAFQPSGRCTTGRAGVQSRPIALTEDARPLAEGEI